MRSVTLNTEYEAARGAGWRHGLIQWLRGMPSRGEDAWISSPSGIAKYLPSSTWLSRHIHSAPFPSLLCSAQKLGELARSASQVAKRTTEKFLLTCQRSQKFTNLERIGFAFLKPLGLHLGSHMHTERGTGEKKCCQMVFLLPDDLEKGTLKTRQAVSADFSELVFHIHYLFFHTHMAGF